MENYYEISQPSEEPKARKNKLIRFGWIVVLIITLTLFLVYFTLDRNEILRDEGLQAHSNQGFLSKMQSLFTNSVSLEEIQTLEEKVDEARRIPDYELLIEIYIELIDKIDNLKVDDGELYKLGGYSLEEYKRLKKERYGQMLKQYESLPYLITQQEEELKSKIDFVGQKEGVGEFSNSDVEKAFYLNNLARLYITKKDYPLSKETLDKAYELIKHIEEGEFMQIFYKEEINEDGTIIPARASVYTARDIKKKILDAYLDLWEITGEKEQKIIDAKKNLEKDPNNYDAFVLLEVSQHYNSKINNSKMLEFYKYVDSLSEPDLIYQEYLNLQISYSYKELKNYEGQRGFLEETSTGHISEDIPIANTFALEGELSKAIDFIESNHPGSGEDLCYYKGHFYNSLGRKSSNGYNGFNNTYFEISIAYFKDCKISKILPDSQVDYYIADNYYWMGEKELSLELLKKIINNEENAQLVANAQNYIDAHGW